MLDPRWEDKDAASVGTVGIATTIFVCNYLALYRESSRWE